MPAEGTADQPSFKTCANWNEETQVFTVAPGQKECVVCDMELSTNGSLRKHLKQVHRIPNLSKAKPGPPKIARAGDRSDYFQNYTYSEKGIARAERQKLKRRLKKASKDVSAPTSVAGGAC